MRELPSREQVLEKIRSRGYWKVIIRPLRFKKTLIDSLKECITLVEENSVRFRGSDYPMFSKEHVRSKGDYIESVIDWDAHVEVWRMYQSGQFVHLAGVYEDWWKVEELIHKYGGPILSTLSTLYTVTEIYEFASRLAQKNLFENRFTLSIQLNGMKNRILQTLDFRRILFRTYICDIEEITDDRKFSVEEIITKPYDLALDHTIRIFAQFNWMDPPREILKQDQKKFLEGRF